MVRLLSAKQWFAVPPLFFCSLFLLPSSSLRLLSSVSASAEMSEVFDREDYPVSISEIVEDARRLQINEATVLLYPFREMKLAWWDEFIHSFRSSERATVTVRVMDCLMAHALLHEDPFLEEAVVQIGQKLPKQWSGSIGQNIVASFEVSHHIFKTICVTAKFPSFEQTPKLGLLKMSEQRILEIEKAAKKPEMKLDAKVTTAVRVVMDHLQNLRQDMDSRNAFVDLMDSMKELFFTVSTKSGVEPPQGPKATWFDTFVCCEGCPCCNRLRSGPTLYLRDMEKAKIIDCLMMCAVKQGSDLMRDLTTELMVHHYRNYMENPALDDIGRRIQNGRLFYCRTALYETLGCIQDLARFQGDAAVMKRDFAPVLDRAIMYVLWVKNEVKGLRTLGELVPCLDRILVSIEAAIPRLGNAECRQHMATIEDLLLFAFEALSAPEYHLAVHSRDVFLGKPADMKCGNTACPGLTKDLLKCSGCDIAYYCSPECQKEDWEKHKNFCHEIESRRAKPGPTPFQFGPAQCVKPVILP